MENLKLLEYVPFGSAINPSFWHKLTDLKLEVDKLNETERELWGYFSIITGPHLEVDSTSFNKEYERHIGLTMRGTLINKNTVEQFKECNKNELIREQGLKLWTNITNGDCIKDPSLLNSFFVLSYADLKKYHYYYWFAFPTPANLNVTLRSAKLLAAELKDDQLSKLYSDYKALKIQQRSFFLIKKLDLTIVTLDEVIELNKETNLSDSDTYYLAYSDPCKSSELAGWTIRNYILFILHHCPALHGKVVSFLSLRVSRRCSKIDPNESVVFEVSLPEFSGDVNGSLCSDDSGWIGWERNERNKMGPRMSNMKDSLDPKCLMESSVDLNVKLMKWRLLPDIDLDKIKKSKCLLLGSGTLGCSVARVLLGWGVRKIDFVDNSTVSYSNPVRQSLFNFEDCVQNKPKSLAAAENLTKIFPGVEAQGFQLNIPMPGHPIGESLMQQTKENVEALTDLIKSSDIIFLLMDSRESRWLPTVLGMHYGKLIINAALGFDTYLVMRHGVRAPTDIQFKDVEGFRTIPGNELGCYFCNDVTAPGNSLKDRTLDQQCTVTRPGISQIAGALAVELAISVLQHEHGSFAPAYYKYQKTQTDIDMENECVLGILPHSIRGFLSTFTHVLPATEKYKQCIACSEAVLNEYSEKGFEFLLQVFESSKCLEDLTGLSEIYNVNAEEMWELEDSEDEN